MLSYRIYKFSIVVVFLNISFISVGQRVNDWAEWERGRLFLTNGDTLVGDLLYEYGPEIVQFKDSVSNNGVKTYSSFLINGFEQIVNGKVKKLDRYYWNRGYDNHKKTPDFFLTVYDNKLKLLAKEKKIIVSDDWPMMSGNMTGTITPSIPSYYQKVVLDYFIVVEDGNIYYVKSLKKIISELFEKDKDDLMGIIKSNSKKSDKEKLIEIIKFVEKN